MGMSYGYGKAKDENETIKLIHKAYGMGVSFFDTAEVYDLILMKASSARR